MKPYRVCDPDVARALYRLGYGTRSIASLLSISRSTVQDWAARYDWLHDGVVELSTLDSLYRRVPYRHVRLAIWRAVLKAACGKIRAE
jgi:uncharacterized protein YjcR